MLQDFQIPPIAKIPSALSIRTSYCICMLDALKKKEHILPNGGLMVICHGTTREEKTPKKNKSNDPSLEPLELKTL